jgi:hypothetical protein
MFEKIVLVFDGTTTHVYPDLRGIAMGPVDDMVADAAGRVYVT